MQINRTLLLTPLVICLALNAMQLQANDSWSQQLIGALFNRESAKIMVGVTSAAIMQGTAQRFMTKQMSPNELLSIIKTGLKDSASEITHSTYTYNMGEYKKAVLLNSVVIGMLATAAARIGTSPLSASDVIKPVGIGMGIVAASYALGYLHGDSLMDEDQAELDLLYDKVEFNKYRRYATARDAYNAASLVTPLVVAGVGGYMIYNRYFVHN